MAYRKRIKIMKGLNLNVSGSGLSLSAGVKGASVTFGKNGNYLNTGIPGTGLYKRTKLNSLPVNNLNENINILIELDEKGNPKLILKNENGIEINNELLIRKIKQSDKYKESIEKLIFDKKNSIEEQTDIFINIFKHTPQIISENLIKKTLDELKPSEYLVQNFNINEPEIEFVKLELEIEAKKNINRIFFWQNKKLRENYINNNLEVVFNARKTEWTNLKSSFIDSENKLKTIKDKELYNEFTFVKNELELTLAGNVDFVESKIEQIINEIVLPVEFTLDYEYKKENNILKVEIDLPDIEDMPKEKANILSTGKISIKNKNIKELKQEYSQCVTGIAFFFGGTFFNISPIIENVLISGFTKKINTKNGKNERECIYSILFSKEIFTTLNFEKINTIEAFSNFENNMKLLNDFEFKGITPIIIED